MATRSSGSSISAAQTLAQRPSSRVRPATSSLRSTCSPQRPAIPSSSSSSSHPAPPTSPIPLRPVRVLLRTPSGATATRTMHPAPVGAHWPPTPPDELQHYDADPAPPDPLVDFGSALNLAPPHLPVAPSTGAHSLALDGWSAVPQTDYGLSGRYQPAFSPPLEPSPFLLLSREPALAHPPFLAPRPPPQPTYRQLHRLMTTTTATTTALEHALARAHAPPQPQLPHGLHPHTPPQPFAPAPLYADHAPVPPPEQELGWPSSVGEGGGGSGSASSGSASSGEWDSFVALLEVGGGGGGGLEKGEEMQPVEGFPPGWAEGDGTGLGGSAEGMMVDEGDGIDWSLAGPTIPPSASPSTVAPGPLAWLTHPPPRSPALPVPLELFLPAPLAAPPAQQPPTDPAARLGPLDAQLAALFPALVSTPAPHPPLGQLAHFATHDALPLVIPGSDAPPAAAAKPRRQARPSLFAPPFGPGRGVSAHEAAIGGFPVVALPPAAEAGLPASKPQVEKVPRGRGLVRSTAPAHPSSRSDAIAAGDASDGGAYVPPPGLRRALTAPASAPAPPRPALFRPEGAPVGGPRRGDEWYSASEFWAPWKTEGALVDVEGKEVPLRAEIETPASFVFDNEIDAWLTYRRNFLSLRVTLSLPLGVPLSALRLSKDGSAAPIDHLEATLSAHMFPKGTPVELLQFDAARTLRTAQPVSPAPLALVDPASAVPGAFSAESIPVEDVDGPPLEQHHRASFARVQFRSSTANGPAAHSRLKLAAGGADDARFVVRCCVRAVRADGSRADVGGWESAALCVRGRSPGNFGGGKGAAGAEGKKAKGKRARKAPAQAEDDDDDDDEDGGEYRDGGAAAKRARLLSSSSSSQLNGADIVVGIAAGVVTRRRAAAAQKKKTKKPAVTAEGDLIV